jgi:hypothetical protein
MCLYRLITRLFETEGIESPVAKNATNRQMN